MLKKTVLELSVANEVILIAKVDIFVDGIDVLVIVLIVDVDWVLSIVDVPYVKLLE